MAKMIPKMIEQTASSAEKKIFYELENLSDEYTVFHSLNLPQHLYKITGEIDFVIISKLGILCLEVKGGQVERKDGIWKFTDRNGNSNTKTEGPYEQVQGNMYTLMKYLKDKLGEQDNIVKAQFANAVVFTDIEHFVLNDIEFQKEITIDASRLENNNIENIIKEIFEYYAEKNNTQYHFYRRQLAKNDLEKLSRLLREDFGFTYSLNTEINEIEKQIIKLTEKQQEAFKEMDENDRIIIRGTGGTGKTLILYEQAIRKAIQNKKVIFVCFNKLLAKYLNKKLEAENQDIKQNIQIWQIHSYIINQLKNLGITLPKKDDETYFTETLPKEFLNYESSKFDILIIDEAQDLLNYNYIDVLDKIVDKGLKDGIWYMGLDPSQNLYNKRFDEVYEYIKMEIRPTIKKLNDNCRNTKQISYQNEMFTQIEQSKNEFIDGKDVKYIKYIDENDQKEKIKEIIKELKRENIKLENIVILSKYTYNNSVFKGQNFLEKICNIKLQEEYFDESKEGITFSTIHSFKGLESPIVILCDVDKLDNKQNQLLNYVAISRTKELLYILLNENAYEEYSKNILKTYEKIMGE